jgi:hypothetical protein
MHPIFSEPAQLSKRQIERVFRFLKLDLSKIDLVKRRIFITCPFEDQHSTSTGSRDALFYYDYFPHIHCVHSFHNGKNDELAALNDHLVFLALGTFRRPRIPGRTEFDVPLVKPTKRAWKASEDLEKTIKKFLPRARTLAPVNLGPIQWLRKLYELEDIIWIGTEFSSGPRYGPGHFKPLKDWKVADLKPGWCFTTGCTFKPGTVSRAIPNVLERKFLILESDVLDYEKTRATLAWAEIELGLTLRSIVYSGKKSLHGWFDSPDEGWIAGHKKLLIAMGFDPKVLTLGQPVRLASVWRQTTLGTKLQSVLYI